MASRGASAPYTWDDFIALEKDDLRQRFDRVTKLRWYAQLGIPEYWLVDPQARTLEWLVLRDQSYVISASLAEDEVFRPERFEGLEIARDVVLAAGIERAVAVAGARVVGASGEGNGDIIALECLPIDDLDI